MVAALALLAILGQLVADGGFVLARHRELQGVADAAARAGAAQLDETNYRASNGRTATLNPTQARAAAGRYVTVRFSGQANITATPRQVTIGLSEMVHPIIFSSVGIGPIRLAVHAVARPRTGIAQAQGP